MKIRTLAKVWFFLFLISSLPRFGWCGVHEEVFNYVIRGNKYLENKQYDLAVKEFNEAVDYMNRAGVAAEFPLVYYNRGRALEQANELQKAAQDYSEAVRLDPAYLLAYNNRGRVYHKIGQLAEAVADYSQMLVLDPRQMHAYNNRGLVYISLGEYDKAIDDFTQALKLDPKAFNVHLNRGIAHLCKGQYLDAKMDFYHEKEKYPKVLVPFLYHRMVSLYLEGKYNECLVYIGKLENSGIVVPEAFVLKAKESAAKAAQGGKT